MDQTVDYLIIGGGIAGITAAETIREKDASGSIAVITNEPHMLYSRVLLPSYLKQRIKRGQVFMRTIKDFDKKNIHVFAGEEAIQVRPERHDVVLQSGAVVRYRKLLISTGGKVFPLPFPGGAGVSNIFRLQTVDDADLFYQALPNIKQAVVLGGGFIALEFLETLSLRGIKTILVAPEEHFFSKFSGPAGSAILEKNFEDHEFELHLGDTINSIASKDGAIAGVLTRNGKKILCDALCVGIGVERNIHFLTGSGITLGTYGVITDEFLETGAFDVYAAGDAAEFQDLALGEVHTVGNWNNAFLQGKAAGANMAGGKKAFLNISSYSITNLGLHISVVGSSNASYQRVIRETKKPLAYQEMYLGQGIIKGAFFINSAKSQSLISRWILEHRNMSQSLALLSNPEVPLDQI
ncbi:MAG: NAD(P)/FAD-dependent oxidoreductase [Candidatus Sungbacteria bacterium]|uniref:NAD(P)/FAD-dependent oxidoreductase n=1 Tax=Candidatus Sungiibacteriota bacterium TaxID=2750080 RepID=A0A9D6LRU1_9BACT|nr:NAD(P)/FAD-dependent oxidoreductase [Candidatus Sungbacteria bacterium]